mmetsp:Transcript_30933/g.67889  ORF Transcript_30933/g.67889 Transcript_30933/m.67889 type:complete len:205 (-) Transcript_30933:115-729(-)
MSSTVSPSGNAELTSAMSIAMRSENFPAMPRTSWVVCRRAFSAAFVALPLFWSNSADSKFFCSVFTAELSCCTTPMSSCDSSSNSASSFLRMLLAIASAFSFFSRSVLSCSNSVSSTETVATFSSMLASNSSIFCLARLTASVFSRVLVSHQQVIFWYNALSSLASCSVLAFICSNNFTTLVIGCVRASSVSKKTVAALTRSTP